MVGKTFKSKYNSNMFLVTELFACGNTEYYAVLDFASGATFAISKDTFEQSLMQNIEFVDERKEK